MKKHFCTVIFFALFFLFFYISCEKQNKPVILWTDKTEFVSYAELYNSMQKSVRLLVVYKENPAVAFPVPKDEIAPDIVIASWLKNSNTKKYFLTLDHLFSQLQLDRRNFYPDLLQAGTINAHLYLLPVSFNLPAIILSSKNRSLLHDQYLITMDEMQTIGSAYNKQNKNGLYTAMGFAPSWNSEFMYLALKLHGINFGEKNDNLTWNNMALSSTVNYLKQWTVDANTSSSCEEDFKFKYLYTPAYKLVSNQHCLFALIRSDVLFGVSKEKTQGLDFRWIHENGTLPVEDDFVALGIYNKSKNINAAESFIIWFMQEENQKKLLERTSSMKLNTTTFGIAGGFSSHKLVNERVFPLFYPMLLRNIPQSQNLSTSNILPTRWLNIKEKVILPYMKDALDTSKDFPHKSMPELLADWNKKNF